MPRHEGQALDSASPRGQSIMLALQVALAVQLVAFSVSTAGIRDTDAFDTRLDGWLQGSAYVTCALVAVARPLLSEIERTTWALTAAAVTARAAAFVYFLVYVRTVDDLQDPTLADAGWLAMYVFLAVVLLLHLRSGMPRLTRTLALDGIVALCAAGGFAFLVLPRLLREADATGTGEAAVLVNTLYPVLDVTLLVLVLVVLFSCRWRPPPAIWALSTGVAGFAVVDTAFLYALVQGTFHPASPLSALSLVATATIALSAWVPDRQLDRIERPGGLAFPALLALTCLGLLFYAGVRPTNPGVPVAAGLGLAAAVARMMMSFRLLRLEAVRARRANRANLLRRLVEAQDAERARIAADVHDDSMQSLASVNLRLGLLRRRLVTLAPDLADEVDVITETVRATGERLRDLAFEIESPAIEGRLADAVRAAAEHVFRDLDVTWTVEEVGNGGDPPPSVRGSAYRIVREALMNARKHARASTVTVTLDTSSTKGLLVTVADDGVGVQAPSEPRTPGRRMGLTSMHDRAVASGGWWRMDRPDGGGTRVSFWLPVSREPDHRRRGKREP